MNKLELNDDEQRTLLEVLKDRVSTLREEVYHSETFSYTDALKKKELLLSNLIQRIEAPCAKADVRHAS